MDANQWWTYFWSSIHRWGNVTLMFDGVLLVIIYYFYLLFESCLSIIFSNHLSSHSFLIWIQEELWLCFSHLCLCCSTNRWVLCLERQLRCLHLSALNASKAVDRVDNNTLFKKLVARNSPQCLLQFIGTAIEMLLFDGAVHVVSCSLDVYFGVPEWGVLPPLFFNLYVHDLICRF